MRYFRLWIAFFRNCLMREMEYRGHFFMRFMIDMVWYGVQISLFEVIYLNTPTIAGISHELMIVFLGTLFVADSLNMMLFSENFWIFPRLIGNGELDFYLIKPISTFFLTFTRYPNIASVLNFSIGIGVLIHGISIAHLSISFVNILLFAVLILCGSLIMLAFEAFVAGLAIFTVRAEGIQIMFYNFYQLAMKPDAIYFGWMRRILLTIFPMALIASVPAQILVGSLPPIYALWDFTATILMLYLSSKFFYRCLRSYSGASS